jgi:uncharacterized phage protein (TIGR01671 family)
MAQRIIKFRGKHIETGEWLYGSHYDDGGEQYILPNMPGSSVDYEDYQVDPNTVGQYTGLTDKYGNGVYEGDILRLKTFHNLSMSAGVSHEEYKEMQKLFSLDDLKGEMETESITAVAFDEGMMMVSQDWENDLYIGCLWGDQKCSNPIFDFEVIGNIHDNPEIEMHYADRWNHVNGAVERH